MYFEIVSARGGGYFWRIRAANHEILAHSEVLTTKAACTNAIRVVQTGAPKAPVYDRT